MPRDRGQLVRSQERMTIERSIADDRDRSRVERRRVARARTNRRRARARLTIVDLSIFQASQRRALLAA